MGVPHTRAVFLLHLLLGAALRRFGCGAAKRRRGHVLCLCLCLCLCVCACDLPDLGGTGWDADAEPTGLIACDAAWPGRPGAVPADAAPTGWPSRAAGSSGVVAKGLWRVPSPCSCSWRFRQRARHRPQLRSSNVQHKRGSAGARKRFGAGRVPCGRMCIPRTAPVLAPKCAPPRFLPCGLAAHHPSCVRGPARKGLSWRTGGCFNVLVGGDRSPTGRRSWVGDFISPKPRDSSTLCRSMVSKSLNRICALERPAQISVASIILAEESRFVVLSLNVVEAHLSTSDAARRRGQRSTPKAPVSLQSPCFLGHGGDSGSATFPPVWPFEVGAGCGATRSGAPWALACLRRRVC